MAINPQEIRIGNILQDEEGNICVVRLIDGDNFITHKGVNYHGSASCYIDKYHGTIGKWLGKLNGIPIDMNWLNRLGFKPNADMPWLMENGALMCNTGNHWIWHWSGRVIKEIKYVHELQNVMFALSGRELEIK